MNTNVKKILLTGSALVAVSFVGIGGAQAQVTSVNGAPVAINAPSTGVNFQTDHAANVAAGGVAIGNVAGDSIVTVAPGTGTLNFTGGTNSISGTVGAVREINVSNNATLNFGSTTLSAQSLTYGTGGGSINILAGTLYAGGITFGASSGIIFGAGSTYTGTATGANNGTLSFNGASTATTASLGTTGNALGAVNISAGMTGGLNNRVYATDVNLTGAGTTTFGGGITGNLNLNHANAVGILSNGQSITGNVTSNTPTAGELQFAGNGSVSGTTNAGTLAVNGASGTTAILTGAAAINALTFGNNGSVTFGNGGAIATAVNSATTGTIRNNGGTLTFTNGLTATNATLQVDGTGGVTFGADSSVASLVKTGAGNSVIDGRISTSAVNISGNGTLTLSTPMSLFGNNANVTFDLDGGTLAGAGGGNAATITGATTLTGTGLVNSQVTNANVNNNSTNNGFIHIANGSSTLNNVTAATGSTVRFTGTQINGTVTGAGRLDLNGGAQQVNTLGTNTGSRLGAVVMSGGAKTLNGNAFVTDMEIVGGASTTGVGVIDATTVRKSNGDTGVAVIDNALTVGTVIVQNGTLTLNGATTGLTTLELGEAGQARTVVFNGTGTPAAITNVSQLGTGGSATVANATAITNASVAGGSLAFGNAGTTVTNAAFTGAGTLNLTNLTTAGAQVITYAGNQGTVQYGANTTFTGSATTNANNTGNLTFGNDATIDAGATIGGGNRLNDINFAGGTNTINTAINATRVVLNGGNVTSTNTTFNSGIHFGTDNAVTLAANTAAIGGNVTTAAPGTGTLNFSGGALTINGNLEQLASLSLANSTVVSPAAALRVTGDAVAANLMDINSRRMQVDGTFTTAGAATLLNFYVVPAAANPLVNPPVTGSIVSTGAATVLAGTRVNMTVDTNVQVLDGQRYTLVSGGGGSAVGTTALTTTNTTLLRFVQDTTLTDRLEVYATRTQMSSTVTNPNNAAVGTMLDSMGAATNPEVIALQVLLQNYQNPADIEKALSTVTPEISGGTVAASVGVANSASTIVNNRINAVRSGQEYGSGMASGDWVEGGHFWGQAFGAKADQDMRNRVTGYEADSYGLVVGADTELADGFRAGLALTYGNTDVDGKDLNRSKSEIDSYQVSLYGDYDLGDSYFVRGQVAYMYSDIETARYNVGFVPGNTARADFSSDQYSARGEVGRQFALDNTFSLTPSVTTSYTYIDVEDFTERGAGGLSLRNVDTDEMEILEFGANLIAEGQFSDTVGGTIRPNIHGGYRYDVIGDKVSTIGALAGGGAAFRTEGFEPAQGTLNIGTGVTWETNANIDFTVNYDYENKSDYDAHSGFVRAGYKF